MVAVEEAEAEVDVGEKGSCRGGVIGGGPGRVGPGPSGPYTHTTNGVFGTVNIAAIVTAVIHVATHGIVTEMATHTSGAAATPSATISPLKLLHLQMICRVSIDVEIPVI